MKALQPQSFNSIDVLNLLEYDFNNTSFDVFHRNLKYSSMRKCGSSWMRGNIILCTHMRKGFVVCDSRKENMRC